VAQYVEIGWKRPDVVQSTGHERLSRLALNYGQPDWAMLIRQNIAYHKIQDELNGSRISSRSIIGLVQSAGMPQLHSHGD